MMNRKKLLLPISIGAVILVSMFSGCVGPWAVVTFGWDHMNAEGTAVRIWGQLTILDSPENWNEFLVWDTEHHDDWQDYAHFEPADNYAGGGLFSLNIEGLDRFTEYHYRAVGEYLKAQNQIRWGVDHTFIPGGPRVWTDNISSYDLDSATLEGDLLHLGGAASVEVFFRYGTDVDNLNMESSHQTMTSIGKFSSTISSLTSNVTIYYKAVAVNDADTWDGLIFNFIPGRPIAVTRQPGSVGSTTALLKGELWHTGGSPTCDVWFAYSDSSPNTLNQKTSVVMLNATGAFEITLNGLTPNTKHWYRAVGDNGVAQDVGEIYEFTTTSGDIILTEGELGHLYQPKESGLQSSFIDRLPDRYQKILENHPVLLRLTQLKGFRNLIKK
jgi:hypothetical protein